VPNVSESGSRTPLPEIDRSAAAALWARYVRATGEPADPPCSDLTCFGDSVELADELLSLVVDGTKRATACAVAELEADGLPVPAIGDRWIACDGTGRPRVVLRTTDVRVGPLSSVDDAFAWDEGEGDRTVEDWLRMHEDYFRRTFAVHGWAYHRDIPVVFERFEVAYAEPADAPVSG
jgi:uncharacterized protein YhfF